MTNQERGCYVELMCYQWEEGFVPDDLKELANICGEPLPAMRRMWKRLEPCFPQGDDGQRRNPRVESERAKADEVSEKRRASALQMHQHKQEQAQPGSTPFASPPVTTQATVPQAATTTQPTVAAGPPKRPPTEGNGYVAGLIRKHCYPPDGKAPQGHDIARDLKWWNVRVARYRDSAGRLEMALQGCPLVVTKLQGAKWSPAKMFTKQGEWADLFERSVTAAGRERKAPSQAGHLLATVMDDMARKAVS